MKQTLLLPLLLSVIAVAAMVHSVRVNTYPIEDNFDRLSKGLKNIGDVLPRGTNVSLRPVGMPIEDILFCNFLLAPRCSRGSKEQRLDTALVICSLDTQDSLANMAMGKTVIWANKDDNYKYYLITGR